MTITDLTNTTWFLNDYIDSVDLPFATYYVDFKSFDATFTYLQVDENMSYGYYIKYGSLVVYDSDMNSQWSSQNYRTITITGGNDITNPNLITWLETNGELISGGEEEKTPTLTYDLSILNLSAGTHTIAVRGKASGYLDSAISAGVVFTVEPTKLSAPTISINGSTLTITDTSGKAEKYYVHLDGGVAEATETTVDLTEFSGLATSAGTYPVTVTALADGYEESDHSNSVEYVVEETEVQIPSGTYKFESTISSYFVDGFMYSPFLYVPDGFVSNGVTYYRISTNPGKYTGANYDALTYSQANGSGLVEVQKSTTGWVISAYRTVKINKSFTANKADADWFYAHATMIAGGAD